MSNELQQEQPEQQELLPVTVKRSQWYRGQGGIGSSLRRTDGTMCCLGFACLAAGHTPEQIELKSYPYMLGERLAPAMRATAEHDGNNTVWGKYWGNSELGTQMGNTNDDEALFDREREAKLIELGRAAGIAFTFED